MPHLIVTPRAARGIERCYAHLYANAPDAAERAMTVIHRSFERFKSSGALGRPYAEDPSLRELVIPFGKGAYLALFRHAPDEDAVYVLAFKHGREERYGP